MNMLVVLVALSGWAGLRRVSIVSKRLVVLKFWAGTGYGDMVVDQKGIGKCIGSGSTVVDLLDGEKVVAF